MKKVIINADDFGLTKGVSLGILDSMEKGLVTETTAMANGLYIKEAIEEAKVRGVKNIGVHLTLTWGKPILPRGEIKSIVAEEGNFHRRIDLVENINYEEVKKEFKAQIEKIISMGIVPTHLDGHHHAFAFTNEGLDVVFELAKEYSLPVRCPFIENLNYFKDNNIKTTDDMCIDFYNEGVSEDYLIKVLENAKDGEVLEIMCHPAYVDEDLINATSYNKHRAEEFRVLTSEKIKTYINENNIELIGFNEI